MIGRFLRRWLGAETPAWSIGFRAPDETRTFQARLPSRTEGMWFDASFEMTVAWNGVGAVERTRALARVQREIIRSASERSAVFALGDRGQAGTDIACALIEQGTFGRQEIREVAVGVGVSADPEDLALERERERVGQRNEVHTALHRARMRRVAELRRDVLSDPVVARVWWFEQHPGRLNELESAGLALDLMISRPEDVVPPTRLATPQDDPVLDAFLSDLEEWEVADVLKRLTTMMEGFQRGDLAERLRARWHVA